MSSTGLERSRHRAVWPNGYVRFRWCNLAASSRGCSRPRIKYALPTPAVALQILKNRLALLNTASVKWPVVARSARKLSQAELARACENAVKQAVMARRTSLTTAEVVQALQERRASQS